jgi:predicted HTH domain antitoxin
VKRKGTLNRKEKREIAIKLLASGSLDIGAIAEITGLSVEELQGLKQGHESITRRTP